MILECGHDYPNVSGRRKRCPDCAEAVKKEQIKAANRRRYLETYEHKRGPRV
jgi:hypothetical protein